MNPHNHSLSTYRCKCPSCPQTFSHIVVYFQVTVNLIHTHTPPCRRKCSVRRKCRWRRICRSDRSWLQWWDASGRPPRSTGPPFCPECSTGAAYRPGSRSENTGRPTWHTHTHVITPSFTHAAKCPNQMKHSLWDGRRWLWRSRCAGNSRDTLVSICATSAPSYPWTTTTGSSSTKT